MSDQDKEVTVTLGGVKVAFKSVTFNNIDGMKYPFDTRPVIELVLWDGRVFEQYEHDCSGRIKVLFDNIKGDL
jgi:hypothetical protein